MNYKVIDAELSEIASAIRMKGGTSDPLVFPSGFVSAISAISGAGTYGSKTITSNGEYDPATDGFDAFSHVTVSVPTSGSTPVLVSKTISENGTYNPVDDLADAYSKVIVNVSSGSGGNNDEIMTGDIQTWQNSTISKLRNYALYLNANIVSVSLDSCQSIGTSAFYMCSNLTFISIPECNFIGSYAFSGAKKLATVYMPKIETIDEFGFWSCESITSINAPELVSVKAGIFAGCTLLNDVSIPKCSFVNQAAFRSCANLSRISIPMCENIIGSSVFANCTTLEKVVLMSESVCLLSRTNAFASTPISNSSYLGYFGSIYVPASLVDSYKAATNWSAYADRITAYVEE